MTCATTAPTCVEHAHRPCSTPTASADLTMRRLGAELGVQPSALYHHFANKQTLLAAVADEILARGARPAPRPATGTRGSRAVCTELRDAMLAYRDGAELVATVRAFGLGAQAPYDELAAPCRRRPRRPTLVPSAARTLLHFVFGHAVDEQTPPPGRQRRARSGARPRSLSDFARAGDRDRRAAVARGRSDQGVDVGAVQLREEHGAGQVEPRPLQRGRRQVHPVERRAAQVGAWSRLVSRSVARSSRASRARRRSGRTSTGRPRAGRARRGRAWPGWRRAGDRPPLPAAHRHGPHRALGEDRADPACSRRRWRRRSCSAGSRSRRRPCDVGRRLKRQLWNVQRSNVAPARGRLAEVDLGEGHVDEPRGAQLLAVPVVVGEVLSLGVDRRLGHDAHANAVGRWLPPVGSAGDRGRMPIAASSSRLARRRAPAWRSR